jgi:hypothetical protein
VQWRKHSTESRIVYEIGVEGYERSMDQEGWSGANYA